MLGSITGKKIDEFTFQNPLTKIFNIFFIFLGGQNVYLVDSHFLTDLHVIINVSPINHDIVSSLMGNEETQFR